MVLADDRGAARSTKAGLRCLDLAGREFRRSHWQTESRALHVRHESYSERRIAPAESGASSTGTQAIGGARARGGWLQVLQNGTKRGCRKFREPHDALAVRLMSALSVHIGGETLPSAAG
jgi:hypothetical protein